MDFNIIIGSIQIALAIIQLKYDHFKKDPNRQTKKERTNFNNLGEAIRAFEYALSETVAYVGQQEVIGPNTRLASLWEQASESFRNIQEGAILADLTFEKRMYWSNPQYYETRFDNNLQRISLENMLVQLRQLRIKYDKLQRKIN
jgi:hypothetical protein